MNNMGENIIDLHDGVDDIKNKIIRCVGNPDDRFAGVSGFRTSIPARITGCG